MNRLLVILLLPLLVSVQSLATVCLAKCSLQDQVVEKVIEKTAEHHGCHQSQSNSENDESTNEGNDCGSKICQLDEMIQSDILEVTGHQNTEVISHQSSIYLLNSLINPIYQKFTSESPPGFRSYFGVALFIQKSSYLI